MDEHFFRNIMKHTLAISRLPNRLVAEISTVVDNVRVTFSSVINTPSICARKLPISFTTVVSFAIIKFGYFIIVYTRDRLFRISVWRKLAVVISIISTLRLS